MLSGIYFVTQKTIGDEPFDATLRRIKAQIDDQKRNYFGLGIHAHRLPDDGALPPRSEKKFFSGSIGATIWRPGNCRRG